MTPLYDRPMRTILFLLLLFLLLSDISAIRTRGPRWWKLSYVVDHSTIISNEILSNSLSDHHLPDAVQVLLRKKQRRLLRENQGTLLAVSNGTKYAMNECQHQFKNRRWNCSHLNFGVTRSPYGKIVSLPCRETAFIYALTSAAVMHAVTRGCTDGSIQSCSCEYKTPGSTVVSYNQFHGHPDIRLLSHSQNEIHSSKAQSWHWGGCSEDFDFGYKFSKEFVDAGEKGRDLRSIMNLHNNEAGRKHIKAAMRLKCKCHGMSGSCTIKSCWQRLPHLRKIGEILKEHFDGASQVVGTKEIWSRSNDRRRAIRRKKFRKNQNKKIKSTFKPLNPQLKFPTSKDLVYSSPSPNFCTKEKKLGIPGTHGRLCNVTSKGVDGCELLCCGRGYTTEIREIQERCNCTFHWCCEVKCKTCYNKKTIHSCR